MIGKNSLSDLLPRLLSGRSGKWMARCAVAALLLGATPIAGAPAAAQIASAAPPPGAARIWFYRNYEPYGSRNYTSVSLNGAPVGQVPPEGTVFYRDVAPGRYHVTVASEGKDANQDSFVELAPGQQAFVKILASNTLDTGGDKAIYSLDFFYARLVPEQLAQAEISALEAGR